MANTIELAKAYVQIVPSAQGIESSLTSVLSKPATAAGKSAGISLTNGIKSAFGTVGKITAAAMTAASGAVVGFGKNAVSAGMAFDKNMSQVAATMGLAVEDITDLRDFAQEMGRTTVFSATQAADALNYMALAGYDAQTAMATLPAVLNLAAAGGIDLAYASDMITDSQSALGLTLDETMTLVDQMARAASKSNTSVEQLGEAILTVGGTARFMSGGTDELATVLGLMADNGIKGSEAGTHLRNMLLKLSSPTEDGAVAMEKLGVSVFDAEGKMRAMPDIFGDMSVALADLTDEQQLQALSDIFNVRDIASAQALLKTTTQRWEELDTAILDASGAAQQMSETQLDNLSGATTLFRSALEGTYIAVSDKLTPALTSIVNFGSTGLSNLTAAFKENGLSGAITVVGDLLKTATASVVAYLPNLVTLGTTIFTSVLDGLVADLPTLIAALPTFLQSFMTLFMGVLEGIVTALPMAVEAFVAALPTLIPQLISGFTALMVTLMENFGAIIEPIVAALPDILTALIISLGENFPLLLEGIIGLVDQIVQNIPAILQAVWDAIVLVWDSWIAPALEDVGAFLGDVWQSIVDFFAPAAEWINTNVIQPISNFFGGMVRWINDNVIQPLANFFRGLWQGIVNAWNTVIGPWLEIARRAWMIIKEGAKAAWEGIKNIWATVSNWFNSKIVQPVSNFFTNMWNGLKTKAKSAWEGIKSVFQPVVNWFKNVFTNAWQGVKNVFSTGGRIFSGIKEGIENVFKTVVNAIIRGINTVVAFPFNAINGFLNTLRGINILGVRPFGWIGNIGVPQIPLLAQGGVLTGPTLMIGGEDGDEAVIPLKRNTEWIQSVAMEMEEATDNGEAAILEEILAKMDNMGIYLDSGRLVGGISGRMDGALGVNAEMRQRGVAFA